MPSYLYRFILAISLLLPVAAQASDAGDFAAASASKQADLLEAWAAAPAPERIELLEALRDGRVAADSSKRAWIENNAQFVPVDAEAPAAADAPTPDEPRKLRLNNRLRGLVETALASHQLLAADTVVRLAAAAKCSPCATGSAEPTGC